MKKVLCIFLGTVLFSFTQLTAQHKTGYEYWKMEHDPAYNLLLRKQNTGDSLSAVDQSYLANYKSKLVSYFESMPDDQKALYFSNRSKWTGQPDADEKITHPQETDVYSGERSMYSQYLISSGIFGFFYGLSFDAIFNVNGAGAPAIPLLAAGASTLVPVLSLKEKKVSFNSLALSFHGKTAGAMQGTALGFVLTGDNSNDGKLILALSTISSITMGRIGYNLGKNRSWTQGQVALYSHYGILMPLEGLSVAVALGSEDPRVFGLASLAFGAGGYLLADHTGKSYNYTRGDVTAITTFTTTNAMLGFSIMLDLAYDTDIGRSSIIIPAIGALSGTLLGQKWVKGAHLTNQQGRNIALATTGGAVIGLGLTAMVSPERGTPYYVVSYITGMTSYALLMNKYKTSNKSSALSENVKRNKWNFGFMPQNIILNRKIASYALAFPSRRINFLPAFTASVTF